MTPPILRRDVYDDEMNNEFVKAQRSVFLFIIIYLFMIIAFFSCIGIATCFIYKQYVKRNELIKEQKFLEAEKKMKENEKKMKESNIYNNNNNNINNNNNNNMINVNPAANVSQYVIPSNMNQSILYPTPVLINNSGISYSYNPNTSNILPNSLIVPNTTQLTTPVVIQNNPNLNYPNLTPNPSSTSTLLTPIPSPSTPQSTTASPVLRDISIDDIDARNDTELPPYTLLPERNSNNNDTATNNVATVQSTNSPNIITPAVPQSNR